MCVYVCCVNDDYNIHTLSHCYSYTAPYKSTKPPLQGVVCSGFNSPWVCNCGCSYNDHSQKFIELAHILLRIERVGKLCTAVTIDPSALLNNKKDKFIENDNNDLTCIKNNAYRNCGSNQIIMTKRKMRIKKLTRLFK